MGKVVLKHVHRNRMTLTQVRLEKGREYTDVEPVPSLFGRETTRQVTRRKKGHLYVEVLIYPTPKEEGEPIVWVMPIEFRYSLHEAARIAELEAPLGSAP